MDEFVVFGKLNLANWIEWPPREREAVERLFGGWIADLLDTDQGFLVPNLLSAMTVIQPRLGPLLDTIESRLEDPMVAEYLSVGIDVLVDAAQRPGPAAVELARWLRMPHRPRSLDPDGTSEWTDNVANSLARLTPQPRR